MTHHVAIIDDETVLTSFYRNALERDGYRVTHLRSTTSCANLLEKNGDKDVDFFVVDIMMPHGSLYNADQSEGGAYTGLLIARDLRLAGHKSPILLFSNTNINAIRLAAERMAEQLPDCIFLQKQDTTPTDLADIITRYFDEAKLEKRKKGILQRLFSSLLLQPNIGGVGVDIKKFGE
jgi:CheY-like chemotaxis protein